MQYRNILPDGSSAEGDKSGEKMIAKWQLYELVTLEAAKEARESQEVDRLATFINKTRNVAGERDLIDGELDAVSE
jgi:hypothetical protein